MSDPVLGSPEYTVRFSQRGEFLQAEVSGVVDAQSVRIAYWRDIAAEGRSRGMRKVLVLDRKKGQPASPAELAELALLFRDERSHFDRVAVIEPTPEFLPRLEHGEIYGREQGINVRIFVDRDQAERWLRWGAED